jgi:hypothetical protein
MSSTYQAPTNAIGGGGTVEQQLRQLRAELARTARQNQEPTFPSLLLTAPGGRTYRVSVSDAGSLVVTPAQPDPTP